MNKDIQQKCCKQARLVFRECWITPPIQGEFTHVPVLKALLEKEERIKTLEELLFTDGDIKAKTLEVHFDSASSKSIIEGQQKQLAQQQKVIDVYEEVLEKIAPDPYPNDVFIPPTSEQWEKANDYFKKEWGFTIDKISAEYGRRLFGLSRKEAREALDQAKKIKENN